MIKSDMKREASLTGVLGLICCAELTFLLVNFSLSEKKDTSFMGFYFPLVLFSILLVLFLCWFIFAISYKVVIDENEIKLRSLTKRRTVQISEVLSYRLGKYRKSNYYQFQINLRDDKLFINVRDREGLIKLFYKHGVKKIS